ncbi:uncharacterized protein LOC143037666 [Oratosquilla oratoria]|uniref:uncharacterized protein LOC143037666 n=1 Tax=Oratosquilla oratoria TaxID=337810 RepID=UPI003F7689A5
MRSSKKEKIKWLHTYAVATTTFAFHLCTSAVQMDTQMHTIFKIDPQKLPNLLHHKVTVKMGKTTDRMVQTIDPMSESIILVNFPEEEDKNIKINLISTSTASKSMAGRGMAWKLSFRPFHTVRGLSGAAKSSEGIVIQ